MKTERLINWQRVLKLLFLPLLITGLLLLVGALDGLVRYHPAYFTEDYRTRYDAPGPLLEDLGTALQTGDSELLQEVQGTRWQPGRLEPRPNVAFSLAVDNDGKYRDYLFADRVTYARYIQHVRQVRGRYVVVPESLYFYVDSGRWVRFIWPATMIWWIFLFLVTLSIWVYRSLARVRKERFGG